MNDNVVLGFNMDVFKKYGFGENPVVVRATNERIQMQAELVLDSSKELKITNLRNGKVHIATEKKVAKKYQSLVDSMEVLGALIGQNAPVEMPKFKFMGNPVSGKTHQYGGYAAGQLARFTNPSRLSIPDIDFGFCYGESAMPRLAHSFFLDSISTMWEDMVKGEAEKRIQELRQEILELPVKMSFDRIYKSITGDDFIPYKASRGYEFMNLANLERRKEQPDYTKPLEIKYTVLKNKSRKACI